jgi:hypothetical protein
MALAPKPNNKALLTATDRWRNFSLLIYTPVDKSFTKNYLNKLFVNTANTGMILKNEYDSLMTNNDLLDGVLYIHNNEE